MRRLHRWSDRAHKVFELGEATGIAALAQFAKKSDAAEFGPGGQPPGQIELTLVSFLLLLNAEIKKAYPDLHVLVSTGNTNDIARRVELNALDLALVTLPVASRALTVSKALRDEFVVVCAADAVRLPKVVRAQDLAQTPLVLFEPGMNRPGF